MVKLNSKVVKPNSDKTKTKQTKKKNRVQVRFFNPKEFIIVLSVLKRSIGRLHFTCKLIRLNKSYSKEPLLAFLKAILVGHIEVFKCCWFVYC